MRSQLKKIIGLLMLFVLYGFIGCGSKVNNAIYTSNINHDSLEVGSNISLVETAIINYISEIQLYKNKLNVWVANSTPSFIT
jgi:hypothetical protein